MAGTRGPLLGHLCCNALVSGSHVVGAGCLPTLYKLCPGSDGQAGGLPGENPGKEGRGEWPCQAGIDHPFSAQGGAAAACGPGGRGVAPEGRALSPPWDGPSVLREIPVGAVGQARLPTLPRPGAHQSRSVADTVGGGCVQARADPVGTARVAQEPPGAGTVLGPKRSTLSVGARSREEVAAARSVPDPALAPEGHTGLHSPATPIAALGSQPPHADSCPRAPTHCPADLSSGPPSPPSASLGPELLDPLRQVLADEGLDSQALGNPQGARTLDSEPLLGATAAAQPWARPTGEEEDDKEDEDEQGEEEECPICTEPYGPDEHRLALLNCGHSLCSGCVHQLLGTAPSAELGRVRCPLCRQKTPMLEWEICQLQEELLQADGPQRPTPPAPPAPPRRGTGPWASLEHRYRLRFLAGPVGGRGCLPFLPCPPCLGSRLWALRERGPCARRLGLLGLLALELLGLLLIFTPLMLLGLLFMLLDRSVH